MDLPRITTAAVKPDDSGSDSEEVGSINRKHAVEIMSNHLILEKIATMLPSASLRSLRPVCTSWSRNFIPEMKKHFKLRVCRTQMDGLLPNLRRLLVCSPISGRRTPSSDPALNQLISAIIQAAVGLQFLRLFDYTRSQDLQRPVMLAFLNHSHSHIHKLKALQVNWLDAPDLNVLIQLAETNKSLNLKLDSFEFKCGVMADTTQEADEYLRLVSCFLATQSPTLSNLKMVAHNDAARRVQIPQMDHLKELSIVNCDPEAMEEEEADSDSESEGGPPINKKAKLLTQTLRDTFPNLTKLVYNYKPGSHHWIEFMDRVPHPGVTTLVLVTDATTTDYLEFDKFGRLFPSLTRLKLELTSRTRTRNSNSHDQTIAIDVNEFSSLWRTWPGLTALNVEFKFKDKNTKLDFGLDAWLTGVPRGRLDLLRRKFESVRLNKLSLDSIRAMSASNKYKARPCIGDLEHLVEFTFTVKFGGTKSKALTPKWQPQLTDMGGYFGLALASSSIQHIVIYGHGKNCVSKRCGKFLSNTFGPWTVINL